MFMHESVYVIAYVHVCAYGGGGIASVHVRVYLCMCVVGHGRVYVCV